MKKKENFQMHRIGNWWSRESHLAQKEYEVSEKMIKFVQSPISRPFFTLLKPLPWVLETPLPIFLKLPLISVTFSQTSALGRSH